MRLDCEKKDEVVFEFYSHRLGVALLSKSWKDFFVVACFWTPNLLGTWVHFSETVDLSVQCGGQKITILLYRVEI